ncbi:molybdenum cofactor biosynthesis protein MoaE [soil metagenome]
MSEHVDDHASVVSGRDTGGHMHESSAAPMVPLVIGGIESTTLDVGALVDSVRRDDCGGIVVFEGTVRSPNQGHQVLALEYEAWEDRVPAQLDAFARGAAERHGLGAALAVHRVGRVEVGDAAVVVVAVSAHRDVAFVAASELIDQVKAEGWIWKKELRADGEIWIDGC